MSLQDDLNTAKANAAAANTALVIAQAAFDTAQPHLSVLDEIEAAAVKFGDEAKAEFSALVAKAKALF